MISARDTFRNAWTAVWGARRLLVVVTLVDFLLCLPAALFVGRAVHGAAGRRTDATEIARLFDPDFFRDLRARSFGFDDNLTAIVVATVALFFVVRPFVTGGYVGIAASRRRIRLAQFVREGAAVYWKFLRISVVSLVAMYLVSLAAKPLLEQIHEWASQRSETSALTWERVTQLVVFAGFLVVQLVLEYARVGVRMSRRPGVVVEIVRSALFVLQHPVRTVGAFFLSLALELAVVAVFAWTVQLVDGAYLVTSAVMLVLAQALVLSREAVRLLHVAAAWHIRTSEAGEERREGEIVPETGDSDLLRAPLPWR